MRQSVLSMEFPTPAAASPKRQAIIDAATKLFLSQGFGAVSVDSIAAEANVSKRTVYSHFENKEALFSGVMTGVCERAGGQDACPLANEEAVRYMPMEDLLRQTAEHVLGVITSPDAIKVYRIVVAEAQRFPQLGHDFFEFGPAFILQMIGGYLAEKSKFGELNINDPEQAAKFLVGMMVFPVQMELACGIREPVSKDDVGEIVARALEAFMALYRPGSAEVSA